MIKKIFIVSTIIFVLALLTFVVWRVFFSVDGKKNYLIEGFKEKDYLFGEGGNELENREDGKLIKLIDGSVQGATINKLTRQILYYQNQKFFLTDLDARAKNQVGAFDFISLSQLIWSENKKKAIIKEAGGFFIYDLDKDEVTPLRSDVDVAVWNQREGGVVYKIYEEKDGKRKIIAADNKGKNEEILTEEIPFRRVELSSESITGKTCFFPVAESKVRADLRCISLKGEIEQIFDLGFGANFLWSPNGQKILVSSVSNEGGNKISLGVIGLDGKNYRSLNFPTTVKKCVWSSDNKTIFCAMINGVKEGSNMLNSWNLEKGDFFDTFWRINIENGKKERLIDPTKIETTTDGEGFFVDDDESYLFFVDRKTEGIFRLEL